MSSDAKLQVYKCPSCGGAVRFDARTGDLTCKWCGNVYSDSELQAKEVEADPQGYLCPECGAELMADNFIVADTCPYCGNNEVAPHRFDGAFQPDYVIPFSITKKQAIECYDNAVAKKKYLPDDYIAEACITSVQGTYVPFWLQDGVVDFDFTVFADDGPGKNKVYSYHRRAGTYDFARVPADGSKRMPDDMMDSIEPYDFSALEPFTTEYLPGFVAERYTVDQDEVNARVDVRVKNSAWFAAKETLEDRWKNRYIEQKRSCAVVNHTHSEQALLPVWLIVVVYRGKKYLVGVNGQTGKVAVNLPVDEEKQNKVARKAAIESMLISVSVLISIPVLVFLIGAFTVGWDETITSLSEMFGPGLAFSDPGSAAMSYGVPVLYGGFLVFDAIFSYKAAKRKVISSMQNVEVARNANVYDVGGLKLTISEMKKGPKQYENNWPEK